MTDISYQESAFLEFARARVTILADVIAASRAELEAATAERARLLRILEVHDAPAGAPHDHT